MFCGSADSAWDARPRRSYGWQANIAQDGITRVHIKPQVLIANRQLGFRGQRPCLLNRLYVRAEEPVWQLESGFRRAQAGLHLLDSKDAALKGSATKALSVALAHRL